MENLFEASCKLVKDLPPNEDRDDLQERLHDLVDITSGIGWGYHDTLGDIYFEYFPNIILKRGAGFFFALRMKLSCAFIQSYGMIARA